MIINTLITIALLSLDLNSELKVDKLKRLDYGDESTISTFVSPEMVLGMSLSDIKRLNSNTVLLQRKYSSGLPGLSEQRKPSRDTYYAKNVLKDGTILTRTYILGNNRCVAYSVGKGVPKNIYKKTLKKDLIYVSDMIEEVVPRKMVKEDLLVGKLRPCLVWATAERQIVFDWTAIEHLSAEDQFGVIQIVVIDRASEEPIGAEFVHSVGEILENNLKRPDNINNLFMVGPTNVDMLISDNKVKKDRERGTRSSSLTINNIRFLPRLGDDSALLVFANYCIGEKMHKFSTTLLPSIETVTIGNGNLDPKGGELLLQVLTEEKEPALFYVSTIRRNSINISKETDITINPEDLFNINVVLSNLFKVKIGRRLGLYFKKESQIPLFVLNLNDSTKMKPFVYSVKAAPGTYHAWSLNKNDEKQAYLGQITISNEPNKTYTLPVSEVVQEEVDSQVGTR